MIPAPLKPIIAKNQTFIRIPFKKPGRAPASGAAADALVRRRERTRAGRHPRFFLCQHPNGVPALLKFPLPRLFSPPEKDMTHVIQTIA